MKTHEHIFVKQTGWTCSETRKQCFLSTNPRFTAESNIIISILWIWLFAVQSVYWAYLCLKLWGKLARRRSWGRRRGWSWYKWVWSDCNRLARCTTDLSDYEWWKLKALKRLRGLRDLRIPKKVPDCLFSASFTIFPGVRSGFWAQGGSLVLPTTDWLRLPQNARRN